MHFHRESNYGQSADIIDTEMTTYYYVTDWKDHVVDTSGFHIRYGHENPTEFPIKNRVQIAAHVNIGNFELGKAAKSEITNFIDITSDTRPEDPTIKLHSGLYYHCNDVFNPEIGDIRLQFTTAGIEGNYVRNQMGQVVIRYFQLIESFTVHSRWPVREWIDRAIRNQYRDERIDPVVRTTYHRRCLPCSAL